MVASRRYFIGFHWFSKSVKTKIGCLRSQQNIDRVTAVQLAVRRHTAVCEREGQKPVCGIRLTCVRELNLVPRGKKRLSTASAARHTSYFMRNVHSTCDVRSGSVFFWRTVEPLLRMHIVRANFFSEAGRYAECITGAHVNLAGGGSRMSQRVLEMHRRASS